MQHIISEIKLASSQLVDFGWVNNCSHYLDSAQNLKKLILHYHLQHHDSRDN